MTSISRNLLVGWLHGKKERECLEKVKHMGQGVEAKQTFQKEQQLVIDGPEELGIILVVMSGTRKRESWNFSNRQ